MSERRISQNANPLTATISVVRKIIPSFRAIRYSKAPFFAGNIPSTQGSLSGCEAPDWAKRGKTDISYQVPLLEIPKMILNKYNRDNAIYAKITSDKISNEMAQFAGKVKEMETKLAVNF